MVKAFDIIPCELLWQVLEILGVPVKLLRLLKFMMNNYKQRK